MENLVHVRFPLLPSDSGENQTRNQEVDAAQSCEDVAFEFLHLCWLESTQTEILIQSSAF